MKVPTQLIEDKGIGLNLLTELVRLTANQHRHVVGLGHKSNERGANTRHHIAIGQQRMCTHYHLGYLHVHVHVEV